MISIVITGANGQLGKTIQTLSQNIDAKFYFTDRKVLNIENLNEIEEFFNQHNVDYCINCAAYTAVDLAETEIEKSNFLNAEGVKKLSEVCLTNSVSLIHISTDFVFDGSQNLPYSEKDDTNPINQYGKSKLKGEKFVLVNNGIVIRTSWLYSKFGKNFMNTMRSLALRKSRISVVDDQIGTPTHCNDLASAIFSIIFSDKLESQKGEIFHFSNEGVASWYDFAKAIFEYSNIEIDVNPVDSNAFKTTAMRPKYSVLSKRKVKETFGIEIPYWRDSLKKCLSK